ESVQMNLSFPEPLNNNFHTAVRLTDVTVRYQDRAVLDRVSLTIRNGEKWVLSGPNGAGKTMLCSLIYADNPQSYVNDIVLFDHPRGGGESIWDIKERIGFLSPELHFYFDTLRTCLETALSGLKEHPFKKEPIREEQIHMAEDLFRYFQLEGIQNKMMNEVSTGIQRVVLFIRVLVKNPSLVLLDEPFIGFDSLMIEKAKRLLDEFCKNRTLLFISHQASEIPSCIDHHAVITNGHLDRLS
ncbi:MAG: ATP-binding cassette domain-containing protein, partial [Bacteroidales bacterium]|nr:ATP-binding cassette domain-containing protein [Bacteroidales bacterium]